MTDDSHQCHQYGNIYIYLHMTENNYVDFTFQQRSVDNNEECSRIIQYSPNLYYVMRILGLEESHRRMQEVINLMKK